MNMQRFLIALTVVNLGLLIFWWNWLLSFQVCDNYQILREIGPCSFDGTLLGCTAWARQSGSGSAGSFTGLRFLAATLTVPTSAAWIAAGAFPGTDSVT